MPVFDDGGGNAISFDLIRTIAILFSIIPLVISGRG
jgi:hypothetical protein